MAIAELPPQSVQRDRDAQDHSDRRGLRFPRHFTHEGVHPYDEIEWERRDAVIPGEGGNVFEQEGVEVPKFWSMTATNVVASKYFRGKLGTPARETSVRQMVDRVVDTIARWGVEGGYFATTADAAVFADELRYLMVHQHASFNSPVWFNIGVPGVPQQASACQPYRARVSTPFGLMPIGEIVEKDLVGLPVYDARGLTLVQATKHNGRKHVHRVQLANGSYIEATPDHVVSVATGHHYGMHEWKRVDELSVGMRLRLQPHRKAVMAGQREAVIDAAELVVADVARVAAGDRSAAGLAYEDTVTLRFAPGDLEVSEAALAGWLQGDGFVGQYQGTNRSLTIEFEVANAEERAWVLRHLDVVFPEVHRHESLVDGLPEYRKIRLYGQILRPFVEKYELRNRRLDIRVPTPIWSARPDVVNAYLRSVFQADGYVATPSPTRCYVEVGVISRLWIEDIHLLLLSRGIYSRIQHKRERREDREDLWVCSIAIQSERRTFADQIGFIASVKSDKLERSLSFVGGRTARDERAETIVSVTDLGEEDVYDIQTLSGEYLSNNVVVHNCFIVSVEDSMNSILDWFKTEGVIFKGGSGSGVNVSTIRSSKEYLSGGGLASGPVSFMRGADSVAGSIKSGGTTRRAAKMVVLNTDHPDVREFIWCKAKEEQKAWALGEQGYDMGLNGEAWQSIQFQNANNSLRATDDFMRAALADEEWKLKAVSSGEVLETVRARELLKEISEATWACGDPGMQFDTTINDWHTRPESGRINASNPCSEFLSLDDTACNLASLNLMRFRREDGEFAPDRFARAVDVMFTAQEILVGFSDYPTEKITANARANRELGIGYANLGALLMDRGLAYDSDDGRGYAAAITALLTGEAYAQSARMAAVVGPYANYAKNRTAHDRVMEMHRLHAYRIRDEIVPADLLAAARQSWDDAAAIGKMHGYRNAQASVLAPTGTISFMLDCDTTGVEPDIALVKYKKLVGGGMLKLVNQTVPSALTKLGYTESQVSAITAHIESAGTIEGAPALQDAHLPIFDCAFKPQNGTRSISHLGHIKMMGSVQPFISGAISKCVTAETLLTTEQGLVRIGSLHEGERPDSFRSMALDLASLDGARATDAFYYGGTREVTEVRLRSGHRVTGTPNHRLLVATDDGVLEWRRLDQLTQGDHVATQYGDDVWAKEPANLVGFEPSNMHGSQKHVWIPTAMSEELAFFLGAYAAEGHVSRSNWTIHLSNADENVIARLVTVSEGLFGLMARVARYPDKCPCIELSSKTLVELLDYLGCGERASNKRIPDAVLRSPRSTVLAFLNGLSLDSYMPADLPKWAICLDSRGLLDDLQAVLTNLGIVHSRITKYDRKYDKSFDEVYASGRHAQAFVQLLAFPEAHKRRRAVEILEADLGSGTADIIPGIRGRDLYALLPKGRSGRSGRGTGVARRFSHLKDERSAAVSRASLERVATIPGVELSESLRLVLERNLHFSPVVTVRSAGAQRVFDVSVPVSHAFVGNGIVNHNTVNLPETATVEDVTDAYVEAWKHGVKAIAIYRDGSKKVQPLSTGKETSNTKKAVGAVAEAIVVARPRRRLPDTRASLTHKFTIEGHEGYITVGLFADNTPGEIFVTMAKEGSTLSGMMDAFATSISLSLQYGVPLPHLVEKFAHMRFEPSGWTGNPELGFAKSIVDYVFRWLGYRFLSTEDKLAIGLVRTSEIVDATPQLELLSKAISMAAPIAGTSHAETSWTEPAYPNGAAPRRMNSTPDAPPCPRCGWLTVRNGTCHKCENCGETTGCS